MVSKALKKYVQKEKIDLKKETIRSPNDASKCYLKICGLEPRGDDARWFMAYSHKT